MKAILAALFITIGFFASGYENSMPDLSTPSNLDPGILELNILHRFYDPVNRMSPAGLFAGGANVSLGMRIAIIDGLDVEAGYTFYETEVKGGLRYTLLFPELYFRAMAGLWYVNYGDYALDERKSDIFPLVALQSEPLFGFLVLNASALYDFLKTDLGIGMGLDLVLPLDMHILAECIFPAAFFGDSSGKGDALFLSLAYKIEIGGHHFLLTLANSPQIDVRRLSLGAPSYADWYLGFTIQRIFSLYTLD